MKKRIISAALIFAVVSALIPALPVGASAAGTQVSASVDSLSPEAAGAYAEVLEGLLMEYELYSDVSDVDPNVLTSGAYGLCYADLIDFEGDGVLELYMDTSYSGFPEEEIWRFNGTEAVKLDEYAAPDSLGLQRTDRAFIQKNGKVYAVTRYFALDDGGEGYELLVHELSGGQFRQILDMKEYWYYDYVMGIDNSYFLTIDGNTIYDGLYFEYSDTSGWDLPSTPEAQAVLDQWPESQRYMLFDGIGNEYRLRCNDVRSLRAKLRDRADEGEIAKIDPQDPLASVAYMGDRASCKMDPDMARAYAEALEGCDLEYTTLIDLGDGYPVMVSSGPVLAPYCDNCWEDPVFWEYQEGRAVQSQFRSPFENRPSYSYASVNDFTVCDTPEGKVLRGAYVQDGYQPKDWAKYYKPDMGRLRLWHTVTTEIVSGETVYYLDDVNEESVYTYSNPADDIGITEDYKVYEYQVLGYHPGPELKTASTAVTAAALRAYAENYGRVEYDYPDNMETPDDWTEQVKKAVLDALGGEITSIYKLADGVYYAIVRTDSGICAAKVRGRRVNGQIEWSVERQDVLGTQEELDDISRRAMTEPNVDVDFEDVRGIADGDALVDYLTERLDNMEGVTPNDPAKTRITQFVESAISELGSVTVSGEDNRLMLDATTAGNLATKAYSARGQVEEALEERDVKLNKEPEVVFRLLWHDADLTQPLQVTFDNVLSAAFGSSSLQLLLADGRHYIELEADNIRTLTNSYGSMTIQLSQEGGSFALTFLDGDGEVLPQLVAPVTVGLPADSETSTVMVSFADGSENWGGQYDAASGVVSFDTPYSGGYEVIENSVPVTDIDGCDEETQEAIRFMLSKGFFTAPDGQFSPDGVMKRYHFTKVIVGMFFALDRGAVSTYTDVPADSQYYPYVASGQSAGIVNGVSYTEFGGELELTVEQMLTLTGRTLQEQRGYAPPEDPWVYLGAFDDGGSVADWAQVHTALSVREGLIELGGSMDPQAGVTRAQAALILYRLFLMLHTVRPVELTLPEAPETPDEPEMPNEPEVTDEPEGPKEDGGVSWVVWAVAAAAAVILAAVAAVLIVRAKRGGKPEVKAKAAPAAPAPVKTAPANVAPAAPAAAAQVAQTAQARQSAQTAQATQTARATQTAQAAQTVQATQTAAAGAAAAAGQAQAAKKVCPNCGCENAAGARFCRMCGTKL